MESVHPTGPTSALLSATAPSVGGPFISYTFTATPVGGGPAVVVTCASPTDCPVTGLKPGVSYDVAVTAMTLLRSPTPPSTPLPLTMPVPAAPTLTAADPTSPTTATATANVPTPGGPWTTYTFTATPIGGGSPVTVTSTTPTVDFTGLKPGTQYTVDVVATGPNGDSPKSNMLDLITPSLA